MVLALFGLFIYIQVKPTSLCETSEYFSEYTQKCEMAQLQIGNSEYIESLGLKELVTRYSISKLVIKQNPAYEGNGTVVKTRTYNGFKLNNILTTLLPKGESLKDYVVAITCIDGFDPVLNFEIIKKLDELEGLIAYEQVDIKATKEQISKDGKWELIKAPWGIISPGPFYLIWSSPEDTYWQGWPFQVKSLRLIKVSEYQQILAKIKPAKSHLGLEPKSLIEEGFNQFRGKCLTCHNLNTVGGKKSKVDLLKVMRSFKESSQSLALIKAVIEYPSKGMSDIKDIKFSTGDMQKINDYLRHLAARGKKD